MYIRKLYKELQIWYKIRKIANENKTKLLEKGFAYKCYLTSEELSQMRIKSRENGIPIKC